MLSKVDVPNVIQCNDLLCSVNHSSELEQYHDQVIHACNEATRVFIPVKTHRRKSSGLIGWIMEHSHMREKSLFWHNLWKDNYEDLSEIELILFRTKLVKHY